MMGYAYTCLRQFPKTEKFVLGTDIRNSMLELFALSIRCAKRYYKKVSLQDLDIELARLKGLVRLSKDLGLLSFKHYEQWSKQLAEIGRMIGGWLRSVNRA